MEAQKVLDWIPFFMCILSSFYYLYKEEANVIMLVVQTATWRCGGMETQWRSFGARNEAGLSQVSQEQQSKAARKAELSFASAAELDH